MVVVFYVGFYITEPPGGAAAREGAAAVIVGTIARFWAGVPIFFVISGYCIAAASDSARRREGIVRT